MKKEKKEKEISSEKAIAEKVKKLQKEEHDKKKNDRVKYMPESRTVIVIATAVICFLIVLGSIFMIVGFRKNEKYADQYVPEPVISNETSEPAVTVSVPVSTSGPVENTQGEAFESDLGTDYHPVELPETMSTTGVTIHNITPNVPGQNTENGGNTAGNNVNGLPGNSGAGFSDGGNAADGTNGANGSIINNSANNNAAGGNNGANSGKDNNTSNYGADGLVSSDSADGHRGSNGAGGANAGNGINSGNNTGSSDRGSSANNSSTSASATHSMNAPESPQNNNSFKASEDTGGNYSDWDPESWGLGTPSTVGGNNGVNTVPFDEDVKVEDWFLI